MAKKAYKDMTEAEKKKYAAATNKKRNEREKFDPTNKLERQKKDKEAK